jgi:hypothetical protein
MEDKEHIHKEVEPWRNGKVKSENGKLSTPSVATLLVAPVSGGQSKRKS